MRGLLRCPGRSPRSYHVAKSHPPRGQRESICPPLSSYHTPTSPVGSALCPSIVPVVPSLSRNTNAGHITVRSGGDIMPQTQEGGRALATLNTVTYIFIVPEYMTEFGQELKLNFPGWISAGVQPRDPGAVVGSCAELGSWDQGRAPSMKWCEGHRWELEIVLPRMAFEFKVIMNHINYTRWEQGVNRVVMVDAEEDGDATPVEIIVRVNCLFDDTANTEMALMLPRERVQEAYEVARAALEMLDMRRQKLQQLLDKGDQTDSSRQIEVNAMREAVAGQSGSVAQLTQLLESPASASSSEYVSLLIGRVPVAPPRAAGAGRASSSSAVLVMARLAAASFLPPGSPVAAELSRLELAEGSPSTASPGGIDHVWEDKELSHKEQGNQEGGGRQAANDSNAADVSVSADYNATVGSGQRAAEEVGDSVRGPLATPAQQPIDAYASGAGAVAEAAAAVGGQPAGPPAEWAQSRAQRVAAQTEAAQVLESVTSRMRDFFDRHPTPADALRSAAAGIGMLPDDAANHEQVCELTALMSDAEAAWDRALELAGEPPAEDGEESGAYCGAEDGHEAEAAARELMAALETYPSVQLAGYMPSGSLGGGPVSEADFAYEARQEEALARARAASARVSAARAAATAAAATTASVAAAADALAAASSSIAATEADAPTASPPPAAPSVDSEPGSQPTASAATPAQWRGVLEAAAVAESATATQVMESAEAATATEVMGAAEAATGAEDAATPAHSAIEGVELAAAAVADTVTTAILVSTESEVPTSSEEAAAAAAVAAGVAAKAIILPSKAPEVPADAAGADTEAGSLPASAEAALLLSEEPKLAAAAAVAAQPPFTSVDDAGPASAAISDWRSMIGGGGEVVEEGEHGDSAVEHTDWAPEAALSAVSASEAALPEAAICEAALSEAADAALSPGSDLIAGAGQASPPADTGAAHDGPLAVSGDVQAAPPAADAPVWVAGSDATFAAVRGTDDQDAADSSRDAQAVPTPMSKEKTVQEAVQEAVQDDAQAAPAPMFKVATNELTESVKAFQTAVIASTSSEQVQEQIVQAAEDAAAATFSATSSVGSQDGQGATDSRPAATASQSPGVVIAPTEGAASGREVVPASAAGPNSQADVGAATADDVHELTGVKGESSGQAGGTEADQAAPQVVAGADKAVEPVAEAAVGHPIVSSATAAAKVSATGEAPAAAKASATRRPDKSVFVKFWEFFKP